MGYVPNGARTLPGTSLKVGKTDGLHGEALENGLKKKDTTRVTDV
jgi:hypothetical protein